MSDNTRQALYDRIRASSKEEVILEEMQRLGFWPAEQSKPGGTEALIKREGELQRELRALLGKQRIYQDPEQALKEMRKQRMAEAKQRRLETKQRRLEEKYQNALRWHARRQHEILYLGPRVSSGLNQAQSDHARLAQYALPALDSAEQLAQAMGISLAELRFLSYTREVTRLDHYRRFVLSKKTGGERLISAPMPRLKRAQYWVLDQILEKIALHDAAHGFRRQRSVLTNAKPHVGAYIVVNYDLKDFFPTFDYARIKGVFRRLGYSNQVATLLAILCSEAPTEQVELDGELFYVTQGERRLPQGAPTSPALTNIICRRLDRRLSGAAASLGYRYTRYADDLSFSGDQTAARKLGKLQYRLQAVLQDEGLILHAGKTRIMRVNTQQQVTGVVVNKKPSLDRKTLRRFRAVLFQIEKDGPQDKRWGNGGPVLEAVRGYANYIAMIDLARGKPYQEKVAELIRRYRYQPIKVPPMALSPARFRQLAAAAKAPRETWWIPAERPEPQLERMPDKTPPALAAVRRTSERSTSELVEEALDEARASTRLPWRTTWRLWWGRVRAFFWIALFIYVLVKVFSTVPWLGFILIGALVYFLIALLRR